MKKPNRRTTALTALGVTGAAVGLGLALVGSPAQAEDPSPSPSSSSGAAGGHGPGAPGHGPDRAQHQDELAAALATELGIDKAKVTAALEKIQADRKPEGKPAVPSGTEEERKAARIAELKTRLDAAVAAGTLTAEESAAILKAADAGVLPQGRGAQGGRPGR